MKLIQNWREVLTRAWSIRLMALAAVLSAAEVALPVFEGMVPAGCFALASAAVTALAFVARLLAQSSLPDVLADESGAFDFRRILALFRPTRRKVGGAALLAAVIATAQPVVERWEGMRTEAYRDVVGVWTVCFGETDGIRPGEHFTPDQCRDMLAPRLEEFYLAVRACAPELAEAPISVQAAVTSWSYNVGVGAACRSTLADHLRAGNWRAACNELPRWNRAGGKVWPGLKNRRADERGLCLSEVR